MDHFGSEKYSVLNLNFINEIEFMFLTRSR